MAPKRELVASKAQGKYLVESSQLEARQKALFGIGLFNTMEDYQWYK